MKFLVKLSTGVAIANLLCLLMVGCGPAADTGPAIDSKVTGKVTFSGKPVTNATISFEKPGLGAWGSSLGSDGAFAVDLATGEYTVTVMPTMAPTKMEAGAFPEPVVRDDIPEAYRAASTSKAKVTINAGPNTYDLALE